MNVPLSPAHTPRLTRLGRFLPLDRTPKSVKLLFFLSQAIATAFAFFSSFIFDVVSREINIDESLKGYECRGKIGLLGS